MKSARLRAIHKDKPSASPLRHPGFRADAKPFSLIELLVVMAIVGILVSLIFPAFASVRVKGKGSQAQADIRALINACALYEADAGYLPNPFSGGTSGVAAVDAHDFAKANANTPQAYKNLMTTLSGFMYFSAIRKSGANPKNQTYLPVSETYSNCDTKNPGSPCGFVDPWGNSYGVSIDVEGNGSAPVKYPSGLKDSSGTAVSDESVFSKVVVYSLGSGTTWNSDGKTLKTSDAGKAIKSWR